MKKTSSYTEKIRSLTKEELGILIKNHRSWSGVLHTLGINYTWYISIIRERADEFGLDYSCFKTTNPGKKPRVYTLDEILVENPEWKGQNQDLKKRLIKERQWEDKCKMCSIGPEWLGCPLTLQLDHINGNNKDNRIENLRILCPNCHSITETWCGKNKPKHTKIMLVNICSTCKNIQDTSKKCVDCSTKSNSVKKDRPTCEQLLEDLNHMTYVDVGKKYDVSYNTIRNWLYNYDQVPPQKNIYHKKSEKTNTCIDCSDNIKFTAKRCRKCYLTHIKLLRPIKPTKPNKPTKEQLVTDRKTLTLVKTGEKYGVSKTTIQRWLNENI